MRLVFSPFMYPFSYILVPLFSCIYFNHFAFVFSSWAQTLVKHSLLSSASDIFIFLVLLVHQKTFFLFDSKRRFCLYCFVHLSRLRNLQRLCFVEHPHEHPQYSFVKFYRFLSICLRSFLCPIYHFSFYLPENDLYAFFFFSWKMSYFYYPVISVIPNAADLINMFVSFMSKYT